MITASAVFPSFEATSSSGAGKSEGLVTLQSYPAGLLLNKHHESQQMCFQAFRSLHMPRSSNMGPMRYIAMVLLPVSAINQESSLLSTSAFPHWFLSHPHLEYNLCSVPTLHKHWTVLLLVLWCMCSSETCPVYLLSLSRSPVHATRRV